MSKRVHTVGRANVGRSPRCTNPLTAPESLSGRKHVLISWQLSCGYTQSLPFAPVCNVSVQHACCAYETYILPEGLLPYCTYVCHRAAGQNPHRLTSPRQSTQSEASLEQIDQLPSPSPHPALSHLDMESIYVRILLITAQSSVQFSSFSGTTREHHRVQLNLGLAERQMKIGASSTHSQHSRHPRLHAKLIMPLLPDHI